MSLFPMFLKLEGRKCLVVGAGKIGEAKIRSLLIAHAEVRVVALTVTPAVAAWSRAGVIAWESRAFRPSDLDGVFLVVAATSSIYVNDAVFQEARQRQILCNVVDDPERCDFYYPAVVRRGALQVAISTEGQSPALAQRLRREFERQLRPVYAGWLDWLGSARKRLFAARVAPQQRRTQLHSLASRESFELRYPEPSSVLEAAHER
jgi:precorrin-2 dehydrogenase/sirohydrochlorin ferrochelatase